jgi:hypothetical protein
MLDRQLHRFYLSFKLEGVLQFQWEEGINLRHAKEKLLMRNSEASDLMDWTSEKQEDIEQYIERHRSTHLIRQSKD